MAHNSSRIFSLGEVIELSYGKALPKNTRCAGNIPVYGSNGITGYHNEAIVIEPTVIVGRKGSAGAVHLTDGPSFPIDTTYYVKVKNGWDVEPQFMFYALNEMELGRLATATGVPGLNREDAYREKIALPPLEEQRRIVNILNHTSSIKRLRDDARAKAREIIPALFVEMFGDPATNPMGSKVVSLGKAIKVKSGEFLPASAMHPDGTFPVYGGNGINGTHNEYLFDGTVVIIGRVGAYCGNVHLSQPHCWVTDNALYVFETYEQLSQSYLVQALKLARLNQYASQSGQPLISAGRIKDVPLIIPPLPLQQKFAERVAEVERISALNDKAAVAAEQLAQSLMSQVFGAV